MNEGFISFAAVAVLTGCASQDTKEQPSASVVQRHPNRSAEKSPGKAADTPNVTPAQTKPVATNPLTDPDNILTKSSIYYDSSVVKDEFKPLVSAHAKYLAVHRSSKMRVEGNTYERGSREYNIALGQKRADGVKQMMLLLGAREAQIEP